MIRTIGLMMTLAIVVRCQDNRRPFFIVGHMVNSIAQVSQFVESGANAIESDVEFGENGTALRTYHGLPCDCLRRCKENADIAEFFRYIRNVTGFGGLPLHGKLLLVFLDLKVSKLPPRSKYAAGVDIAMKLVQNLWHGVAYYNRMNVLLSIGHASDKDVLLGAIHTISQFDFTLFDNVGFDVGLNDKLENISAMYEELGIDGHRWQGDGITNCLVNLRSPRRLNEAVVYRDTYKRQSYVDKVYYWTVDKTATIRKTISRGVDAVITNRPERVMSVLAEDAFKKIARRANARDSPWLRVRRRTESRPNEIDSEEDEMGDEANEFEFTPFGNRLYPGAPRPSRPFRRRRDGRLRLQNIPLSQFL